MKGCILQAYNIGGLCLLSSSLGYEKSQQIVDQLKEKQTFVCEFKSISGLTDGLNVLQTNMEDLE